MIDFTLDHGSDEAELRLSGDLTVESAQKVRVIVLEAMKGGRLLSLDLSALDRVDAAGFQLLCSLYKTADCAGKRVRLASGMPHELRKAAAGAGFGPDGDEWEAGAGQRPWLGGKTDG